MFAALLNKSPSSKVVRAGAQCRSPEAETEAERLWENVASWLAQRGDLRMFGSWEVALGVALVEETCHCVGGLGGFLELKH